MTLFVMIFTLIVLLYSYFVHVIKPSDNNTKIVVISQPMPLMGGVATRQRNGDTFQDPYAPPMKNDGVYFPPDSSDTRGMPVNIQTRGVQSEYQQVGILTRGQGGDLILPLMGRRNMTGRDKWQYYTMSNTGSLSAKLPVSSNGKSCTSEYGCDSLSNGDTIYVDGYNDTFKATIYENNLFRYLPF
jgi:hypothetical protein